MNPIIFASTSHYKQQQLSTLGVNYKAVDSHITENHDTIMSPESLALHLATQKAYAVQTKYPDSWTLGSDQVAINSQGDILTKPGTKENAIRQLMSCSDNTTSFYSAITLIKGSDVRQACTTTKVHFRNLSQQEVVRYIEQDKPYDCAGSFKVESLGISLFKRVETNDPTALIGLPLIALCDLLREIGIAVP